MEQHPIPQNISSYQFRLVGDMTLKQFFQVGAGALISIIIYSLPIHPIIKWPFIIFFSLFGAALAFLPFQERPLEQWILAFFRSIYSPTVFRWKPGLNEEFFQKDLAPAVAMPAILPAPESRPVSSANPVVSALDETEGKFLSKLASFFSASPAPIAVGNQPTIKPELQVPSLQTVSVPKMVVEESVPAASYSPLTTTAVSQTLAAEGITATQAAQFSPDAAPPSPPTILNTVSGQVMDPEGKIIEGAILEVKDSAGRPVRALRTNKAGHFLTVTALVNGRYEISTEKEGFIFEPIILDTTGNIIAPIAIRAKGRSVATHEA